MYKNKKIIAVIPARGGSKRLSRKNIKLLTGKPLIVHTIRASLASKFIDRTIVSTDNKKIEEISRNHKSEVIKRPKHLSEDNTSTIDVIKHVLTALKEKENYSPEVIVLLQPTSPLRTSRDIDNGIKLFFNRYCESVISVCEGNPYWHLTIKKNYIKPLFGWEYFSNKRKQDLPKSYNVNGAIYITTTRSIYKYNSFFNKKTVPYIMPINQSIDIDDEMDFDFAEFLMREKNANKNSR